MREYITKRKRSITRVSGRDEDGEGEREGDRKTREKGVGSRRSRSSRRGQRRAGKGGKKSR